MDHTSSNASPKLLKGSCKGYKLILNRDWSLAKFKVSKSISFANRWYVNQQLISWSSWAIWVSSWIGALILHFDSSYLERPLLPCIELISMPMPYFSRQNSCCKPTKEIAVYNFQAPRKIKKLLTYTQKHPSIAVTAVPFLDIWDCFHILGPVTTWSCSMDQTDQTVHQSICCSDNSAVYSKPYCTSILLVSELAAVKPVYATFIQLQVFLMLANT